jgi:hypothetical protein
MMDPKDIFVCKPIDASDQLEELSRKGCVKVDSLPAAHLGLCEEVFVIARDEADARRIYEMNCEEARRVLRARMHELSRHGVVHEALMPDTFNAIMNYRRVFMTAVQSAIAPTRLDTPLLIFKDPIAFELTA